MLTSDHELLDRLKLDRAEGFRMIYERYASILLRYVYRFTGNQEHAEEILHDIFAEVFKTDFSDDFHLKPWLFTLAKNKSLNFERRRRHEVLCEDSVQKSVGFENQEDAYYEKQISERLEHGIEVAGLFLDSDQIIVKTQGRDGKVKEYKASGKAWSPQTKIVVITDAETASSAEILTAALKERRKAILVGTHTAGKGTIESLEELPNGYKMKYSVRRLLSPDGKPFDGSGLSPDYQITNEKADFFPFDFIKDLPNHLEKDAALKFAVELPLS